MKRIIEAGDLPEKEKVYLKKDMFGWRIVNPIRNPDGSINWINLLIGGWRNFAFLLIVLVCLVAILYSYNHDVTAIQQYYGELAFNPMAYCERLFSPGNNPMKIETNLTINFTGLGGGG